MHRAHLIFLLRTHTIISECLNKYLKGIKRLFHIIFPQKIPNKVINNLQPSNMSRLIINFLLHCFSRHYTLSERASHQPF